MEKGSHLEKVLGFIEALPEKVRNLIGPAIMRLYGIEEDNNALLDSDADWLPESFSPDQPTNPLQEQIAAAFKLGEIKIGGIGEGQIKKED